MPRPRPETSDPSQAGAFRLPFEHGAWWTFETCLAAGLIQALARGASLPATLALALGMQALFLASDWLTGLAQLVLQGRLRGHSHWASPQGLALGLGGAACIALGLALASPDQRPDLLRVLAAWTLLAGGVLWMRVLLPPRSSRLLISSAVLLTGPVLVLGLLAFPHQIRRAAGYWLLWAWFFAAGVNYVQVWMRGNTLPKWRIWTASLPYLAEAGALALVARWPGVLVLSLLSLRVLWRLRHRLFELDHPDGRAHLPTRPAEIRLLGFEQVAWSLALSAIWVWRYFP